MMTKALRPFAWERELKATSHLGRRVAQNSTPTALEVDPGTDACRRMLTLHATLNPGSWRDWGIFAESTSFSLLKLWRWDVPGMDNWSA